MMARLKKILRAVISYATLRYVAFSFHDTDTKTNIHLYRDKFGDFYLKTNRFSFFKVKAKRLGKGIEYEQKK